MPQRPDKLIEIDWRKEINALKAPKLSPKGLPAPEMESIPDKMIALDAMGDFSRLTAEIFFFVDKRTGKTYTMEKHYQTDFGEVPLRDALTLIKKKYG